MNATVAKYVERLKPDQTMDPFDSLVFLCIFFFLRLRWATPLVSGFCSHSATTYITHFRHLYVNFSVTNVIYARY